MPCTARRVIGICRFYGDLGAGFIEMHHLKPLSSGERKTTLRQIVLVCANCHRMLHRRGADPLPVAELRRIINSTQEAK
ncbi:MAG: hypothetical protein GY835_11450 [bacterium]|nr:hypothetical protein [bacterium]